MRARPNRIGALKALVAEPFRRWPQTRAVSPAAIVRPNAGRPLLGPDRPVASLGSCFASEIRKWLAGHNYRFIGMGPEGRDPPRPLFNTVSIRQEVKRAFGTFSPVEKIWRTRAAGRQVLMDPYRHNICFASQATADAELEAAAAETRTMFLAARLIILTIGQAEIWHSKADGAAFSAIPPKDVLDPARHAWRLTTVEENREALVQTFDLLEHHAPEARIILTLSPVPLLATFRDENAVIANTEGKAILRAAIGEAVRGRSDRAHYFPAFEIILALGPKARRADGRHVSPWGVARVMEAFERWAA